MSELQFHPLADLFPLMEGEDFDALVADIAANGLREKIDLYQGKIVEGRNRYLALQRLGIEPSADQKQYFRKAIYAHTVGGEIAPHEQSNDDRVRTYVISKNIHRRHLTAEQKRDLIAKVIAAKPEASDRQIAKQVKADHKTVGSVRAEREATGELSPVEKRTGADGKARKQPAKKRKRRRTYVVENDAARREFEQFEAEEAQNKAEAERLVGLIATDQARALHEFFKRLGHIHAGWHLEGALCCLLGASAPANAGDPEAETHIIKSDSGEYLVMVDCCTTLGSYPSHDAALAAYQHYQRNPEAFTRVGKTAPVENAPPPEVGAEIMKAKMAALDDGLDIPEPATA